MKKAFKKGFTLAEIMIVLTIIGVLTAILLPIANHSRPDENVMKFKKADTTFKNAIRELVNSDKYYIDGDFSRKADGTPVDSTNNAKYMCETMADILNTKSVNCSNYRELFRSAYNLNDTNKSKMDDFCKQTAKFTGEEIKTSDGIVYYQTAPGATFWEDKYLNGFDANDNEIEEDYPIHDTTFHQSDSYGHYVWHKVFCIDIDGIPKDGSNNCDDIKDICPFGYGVRADGKILSGKRADEWLEKGFQKGKDDN